jgi:hypothetical protein
MIDRVPPGLGRLGRVDDAGAMAANIVAMLGDPARGEIAAAARAHAASLSWDAAMRTLLTRVFPGAMARRGAMFNAGSVARAPGAMTT